MDASANYAFLLINEYINSKCCLYAIYMYIYLYVVSTIQMLVCSL